MRVFWWQGGLHVEPNGPIELAALKVLCEGLNVGELSHEVHGGPIAAIPVHDQQAVAGVHVAPEVITDGRRRTGEVSGVLGVQDARAIQAS
jgi:hypothetical protein